MSDTLHKDHGDPLKISLDALSEVLIGRSKTCSLQLGNKRVSGSHAKISQQHGQWQLCDCSSTNGTSVNGRKITEVVLQEQDRITIGPYELVYTGGCLSVSGGEPDSIRWNLPEQKARREAYPQFSRSPRLLREKPTGVIEIESAPNLGSKPEINWLTVLLPLLGTLAVSVLITVFSGSMGMMFSAPMMLIGVVVTILNYRSQSKKFKQSNENLTEKYQAYIDQCEEKLKEAARKQRDAVLFSNPSLDQCLKMARQVDQRLWERTPGDQDFLSVRVGLGQEPLSTEIRTSKVGFVLQEETFTRIPQALAERYSLVDHVPVLCDLRRVPTLGIVGERNHRVRLAQAMVVQAATFHGYDDLRIAVIYPSEGADALRREWEELRWLPHTCDDSRSRRYLASNRYEVTQLFNSLEKTFQQRMAAQKDHWSRSAAQTPHYLFLVADPSLLQGQPAADFLLRNDPSLGISCILLGTSISDLPSEVRGILEARGENSSLYLRDKPGEKRTFRIDQIDAHWFDGFQCNAFTRALAPIRLPGKGDGQSLPDSVTFLDGYRVKRPEELEIGEYWENSRSDKSLSVPMGIRPGGGTYYFDIHEKRSGPHGLVAGTNGSGKSEMAQSWIASMALQFSPQDVNFVLVDFKGTSLLKPFLNLPHLAGSISNLDKDVGRCLLALDNEIQRRQILVDRYDAHDILGYQAKRRKDPSMEEMPFLVLVIDEFADFKAQFPDFTSALDHIFRGGRSLGIYTIIMTQKPSGVVTEQMNANAKFRWCLRVVSENDSREMIGVNDAAYLTAPGRSYVKTGTGAVELVQPFFSGATYYPDRKGSDTGAVISQVMLNGERRKLAVIQETSQGHAQGTQLEAVVRTIADYCRRKGIPSAKKIWAPPLPDRLELATLTSQGHLWQSADDWRAQSGCAATVGMVDEPGKQRQYPLVHDFWKQGHLLVYGMPLSGKTTFLQSLMISGCCRYTPSQVQFYLMEFGGFGLRGMETFPHVGGAAGDDEPELLQKIADRFLGELDRRKKKFRKLGVGSIANFQEAGGEALPSWVLLVDNLNLANIKFPDLVDSLTKLTREGEAFGLYVAATVTGASSPGYQLGQNFKTVMTLQLTERTDYHMLVGRVTGEIPKAMIGRGLVRGPLEFQTAIAFADLSDGKRIEALRTLAAQMTGQWTGPLLDRIQSMPEFIPYGSVSGAPLVLGLSREDVTPVCLPLGETTGILISAGHGKAKNDLLHLLLRQVAEVQDAQVLLYSASAQAGAHVVHDTAALGNALKALVPELRARQAAKKSGQTAPFSPIVIVVDDLDHCMATAEPTVISQLEVFVRLGAGLNVTVIAADLAAGVEHSYFSRNILLETLHEGVILLTGGSAEDHRIVDVSALNRQYPGTFEGDLLVVAQKDTFRGVKQMDKE